jgi:hypothetical protein
MRCRRSRIAIQKLRVSSFEQPPCDLPFEANPKELLLGPGIKQINSYGGFDLTNQDRMRFCFLHALMWPKLRQGAGFN